MLTTAQDREYPACMSSKNPPKQMSDEHNAFHAERRRARRDAAKGKGKSGGKTWPIRKQVDRQDTDTLYLYGLHTVRQAILNPARQKNRLYTTLNGLQRLELGANLPETIEVEEKLPRELDALVGSEAVHQGVVLHAEPVATKPLAELAETNLVLLLDQVTDPHNVGAIMRSAVAMNAGAIITTSRYSPVESGVLAKSASGALDLIDHIEVRNLAETLENLMKNGFTTIGLDSEEAIPFENVEGQKRIALVLGAEGKGLREKTRKTCSILARLDMPGEIKSLNVSNAAALSLYLSRQILQKA